VQAAISGITARAASSADLGARANGIDGSGWFEVLRERIVAAVFVAILQPSD